MKYLKLFESTNHDYFKELEEKTGISHIKPEIDDLFLDLVDNIPNAKITDDLTINLTYKRKTINLTYKRKISYTYYYNALKSAHKLFANEITYLKDFLDKCELSIKLDMEYWKQISVSIDNIEDLQTFKQDLQDIKNRSQSLGYNFWINTSKNIDDEVTIDVLFNRESFENDFEEGSISKFNRPLSVNLFILFECDLDESRLKSSIDFKSQIPSNIISDFDKFVDRFRIPSKDKQELINIIKRGNWNEESNIE